MILYISHILPCPSQSFHLNPIEHLWDKVDRRLKSRKITSKEELRQKIHETWQSIVNITLKLAKAKERWIDMLINKPSGILL